MAEIERKVVSITHSIGLPQNSNLADQIQFQAPGPRQQCTKFSSSEFSKFELKNFLVQFENCVTLVNSEKAKLSLLKGFLTGYASQLISLLSLEDNYVIGINLLKREFLDIPFIIDEIFK